MNDDKLKELKKRQIELEYLISEYDVDQNALKVLANSGYGALGNKYFRYFKIENAEAITLTGQWIIQTIEKNLNKFISKLLNEDEIKDRVILMDTDSVYLELNDIVNQLPNKDSLSVSELIDFLDSFSKEFISKEIQRTVKDIEKKLSAFPNYLSMKRENIADKMIISGKKRYVMNVYDSEGVRYPIPKKKIMGIESVRSDVPPLCRKLIKDTIYQMFELDNDGMIEFIESCKKKILTEEDLTQICFPTGVNGMVKYYDEESYYKSGTGQHIRAALRFNRFIKENNLTHKYQPIKDGDNILYACLKVPNYLIEDVIAWNTNTIPPELRMEKFIDKEHHLYIGYLRPIERIMEAINMKMEKEIDISDFF